MRFKSPLEENREWQKFMKEKKKWWDETRKN